MEKKLEETNKDIYNFSKIYSPSTISAIPVESPNNYAEKQLKIKFDMLNAIIDSDSRILDLGCGNGAHLLSLASKISFGVGVDFSKRFIEHAQSESKKISSNNIEFINCSFDDLAIDSQSIDLLYSFSSIYYYQGNLSKLISEIHRVLKPKGRALIDIGNIRSLNALVCKNSKGIANLSQATIDQFEQELRNRFDIIKWRSFQLLPMWGNRPLYLYPLLHPIVVRLLTKEIKGKMIDERLSSLPFVRRFAFRHILELTKT